MKKALLLLTLFSFAPFCMAQTTEQSEPTSYTFNFTLEIDGPNDCWYNIVKKIKPIIANMPQEEESSALDKALTLTKEVWEMATDLEHGIHGTINCDTCDKAVSSENYLIIKFEVSRENNDSPVAWKEVQNIAELFSKDMQQCSEQFAAGEYPFEMIKGHMHTLYGLVQKNKPALNGDIAISCACDQQV